MKVGDLVRLRAGGSYGIIIAKHNNPEWNAGWEYTVLWNAPNRYQDRRNGGRIWYENELEVVSESR